MENTNPQVFISFRGEDAREKFLPLLKDRLKRSKVNVFTDEDASGVPLEHLLEEIRNSRIAVVLLSKNYAESHWCLNELVEIKKCIETKKLDFVIPVFYKVKTHHVKKQSGRFGEKFLAYQEALLVEAGDERKKKKRANSKIKRWKKALTFVARMIGVSYDKRMSDSDFAKKIVEKVNINLAQIAAKEGRYSIPQNITGNVSNMYVFHVNQLSISELHVSQSLEALSLASSNLDSLPGNHRRAISYQNHIDQTSRLSVESAMTENRGGEQGSNDSIVPENNNTKERTTCISFLCYWLKICLSYIPSKR
ncbi:unnamed protein product [Brassica oleracea var. botrytis]|uniref:BnaC01g15220D protein n=4 Tax=Brassica TaxID=3705 RepID=A0A078FD54_BRANA|nr:hypothetical protein HID58_041552 [Brassica napus]CAF2071071.1 unnamed protein product [Brassica napus]CDY10907.1 BnaC01g15220D [Brassica napus]VDD49373.1 unnamed protein product [Brassica oleracea]